MAAPNPAKNRRALNLLELVLELDPALRGAYLETIGRQDPETKRQVLALLRALGGSEEPDGEATTAETRTSSLEMPERVGPYKIVREIGRGGMSRVYLAERADQEFERQVALKVIDQGLEAPIVHQRFLAERQILASFDSPQIAKLFDGGTLPNGPPYLVMELVEGVPADQFCAERQLGLEERLRLFRKICGAVSYAHQKLVVHRDLKPSNILVTPEGEPKLLDFGIAKLLDPRSFPLLLSETTRSRFRPMTPSHASPEQLLGEPITTATDIYALGVLLFQLLTGALPDPQQDRLQQVLRERAGEVTSPKPSESLGNPAAETAWPGHDLRRLARQLRGDLDNIVAKALRPQPADRYASVAELEEDLRRYLGGEPVRATRETPLYLVGKFLRRYRLPVAVAATVLVLVTGFALVTRRQAQRIAVERDRSNEIRGFLAGVVGSADSLSRQTGTLSPRDLLMENLFRLQVRPFQDPQTQYQLLELLGDAFGSSGMNELAIEVYSLALEAPESGDFDRGGARYKLAVAAIASGRLEQATAALNQSLQSGAEAEPNELCRSLTMLGVAQLTGGRLGHSAESFQLALRRIEVSGLNTNDQLLAEVLRHRLSLISATSTDPAAVAQAGADLLAIVRHQEQDFSSWEVMSRTQGYLGDYEQALSSFRFLVKLSRQNYGYETPPTRFSDELSESLLRQGRIAEAKRANALSLRSAREQFRFELQSPRSAFHLAQMLTREGEILQELDRDEEAATSLRSAIEILEPMTRDTTIIFAKSTLARAYMLAGRPDEARLWLKVLLEQGWRRPDLLRLAAEKNVLPDPMPPPLELDLSLPPKLRAYIDSLSHEPPPWRTATDLPTIEEILAAEETRSRIAARSPG